MARISLESEYEKIAGDQEILGDPLGDPAYLYCRSSDQTQAEEGRESLSRQLLFAHEQGRHDGHAVPLDMVYWDVWEGKDTERPEFMKLLSDVGANKRSDIVYIDKTDRLSRKRAVYYVLSYDLEKYGLTPVFEGNEDELIRHIKLAFDEIELERRRYRQIQANKARAQKGYVISKFAPFGYEFTEDRKQYQVREDEAIWVRKMYEWCAMGKPLTWIARQLNANIDTPGSSSEWQTSTVGVLLKNEVYKGVYIANRRCQKTVWEGGEKKVVNETKPEDEWIYVDVPAIVSEELWDEVRLSLERNKQKALRNARRHHWLLSGLVRCACGYSRYCHRRKYQRKDKSGEVKVTYYEYYKCTDRSKTYKEDRCHRGEIAKRRLETYVLQAVDMMLTDVELWDPSLEEFEKDIDRQRSHLEFHQQQIAEINEQLSELLTLALESRTAMSRTLFREKREELERQLRGHQDELTAARQRLAASQNIEHRREAVMAVIDYYKGTGGIESRSFEKQREIITLLIDEIVVETDEDWFEIRGALPGVFSYRDGQVVSKPAGRI